MIRTSNLLCCVQIDENQLSFYLDDNDHCWSIFSIRHKSSTIVTVIYTIIMTEYFHKIKLFLHDHDFLSNGRMMDTASVLISVFSSRFNCVQHAIKKAPRSPCQRPWDALTHKELNMITFHPSAVAILQDIDQSSGQDSDDRKDDPDDLPALLRKPDEQEDHSGPMAWWCPRWNA